MFLGCSYFFGDFSLDVLIKYVLIKKMCINMKINREVYLSQEAILSAHSALAQITRRSKYR